MNEIRRQDFSIPMEKASLYASFIIIPIAIIQITIFLYVYRQFNYELSWNILPLIVIIGAGVALHEVIHAAAWAYFGKRPFKEMKFGFLWKTLTPYAYCPQPIEINAYRIGTFLPGLLLGIIPFIISLALANNPIFIFSLFHTLACSGDWLVLWSLRKVRRGSLVEDHPTHAGCYVLEPGS